MANTFTDNRPSGDPFAPDPGKLFALLDEQLKYELTCKAALEKHERIDAPARAIWYEELNPNAVLADERRYAKMEAENGGDFSPMRSKDEIRKEHKARVMTAKEVMRQNIAEWLPIARKEVERFAQHCTAHIDAMEEIERDEYERWGVTYIRSHLICSLRHWVNRLPEFIPPDDCGWFNRPRSFLPWLPQKV